MTPDGWKKIRLAEATGKIGSGVTPRGGESAYKASGYPLIRSQNVGWGRMLLENVSFINIEQHDAMANSKLKRNDVLLNITGASIGRVATFKGEDFSANINQHVCIIRSNGKLEPRFIESYLLSDYGQKQIDQFQAGGNRQGLNFKQVASFQIPLPPLPEQQRIAEILLTWDRAIDVTERLVSSMEAQKKALMQQLFPRKGKTQPKRRFPEFRDAGVWATKILETEGDFLSSLTGKTAKDFDTGNDAFIPYMNVFSNTFTNPADLRSVNVVSGETQNAVAKGDVLFTISSETPEEVGMSSVLLQEIKNCYLNSFCALFRFDEGKSPNSIFFGYLLRSAPIRKYLSGHAQGATRYNIARTAFRSLPILLPSSHEQQKIADCLGSLGDLIAAEGQKVNALKAQKKALMQQLLTGKRRVSLLEKVHG